MESKYIEELKSGKYGTCLVDEPMKNHTTFKVGGPADLLIKPSSEEEIEELVKYCKSNKLPLMIVGNGSNLLVKDSGIRGVVLKLDKNFNAIEFDGDRVIAQAGALLSTVSKKSFKKSLTGMERVSGIPASIGGAMTMNAGAYGTEMKDIVESVKCVDQDGNIRDYSNEEMHFRYRGSRVDDEKLTVISATFKLEKGDFDTIMETFEDYDHRRRSKQPLEKASAGSTFKRPEGHYASKLIDDAGLRGFAYKDAQVSDKHCGFIINNGDASYEDIQELIHRVQDIVFEKYQVRLETEVKIVGD